VLIAEDRGDYEALRLEAVRADGGEVLWRAEGLARTARGDYSALLPAERLPAGRLILRVQGRRAAGWVTAEEYRLRVEAP
jgi:hypothetical protein